MEKGNVPKKCNITKYFLNNFNFRICHRNMPRQSQNVHASGTHMLRHINEPGGNTVHNIPGVI